MADAMSGLVSAVAALPGLRPCRSCGCFRNPADADDSRQWFEVVVELDEVNGAPTPEGWSSLAFLTASVNSLAMAGRAVELSVDAAARPGQRRQIFLAIEGELEDITPAELVGWLHDLALVEAAA